MMILRMITSQKMTMEMTTDDELETITCPECGFSMYEDADYCAGCGYTIERQGMLYWEGKPHWWIILGGLGIVSVIFASMVAIL